jgi:hypothetical protein
MLLEFFKSADLTAAEMKDGKSWREKKGLMWAGLLLVCLGLLPLVGEAEGRAGIEGILAELPGRVTVDSRLRYEEFEQAGGLDVDGISHRIRYGFVSDDWSGLQLMAEGETLYAWGHGRDLHPADNSGDGTELNQLWVSFRRGEGRALKVGRQIYTLDDHRFIGHVGWRQNIQTFDAITGEVGLPARVRLKGFFLDAVNTVTGSHNAIEAWGLNAKAPLWESLALTVFYYSIDGRTDMPAGSGNTLGIRLAGGIENDDMSMAIELSYARQWENAGFPGRDFGHDYGSLDVSLRKAGWTLGAGFEVLGGNGIHGFSTPLATLHKFNGFADVFLGASASGGLVNGLEDLHARIEYLVPIGKGLRLTAIHHWFEPRRGTGDYGREVDLVASYAIGANWTLLGKYGRYSSLGGSGGVGAFDKKMLTLEANFMY